MLVILVSAVMNEQTYRRLRSSKQFMSTYSKDRERYPKLFGGAILFFILLMICSILNTILPRAICWMVMLVLFHCSLMLAAIAYGLRSYIVEFDRWAARK